MSTPIDVGRIPYAAEKFARAVDALATGPGDVRERLISAYKYLFPVTPEHLPNYCRNEYRRFIRRITKYPAEYPMEGDVHASCRRMRRATGAKLAQIIVDINYRLRAWDRRQREVKKVGHKPFSYDKLIPRQELREGTPNPATPADA